MDVRNSLTAQEKHAFANLQVELAVLKHLLAEREQRQRDQLAATLQRLGYSPNSYGLYFSHAEDVWEVKLRPDALTIPGQPNRAQRRHTAN